MKNYLARILDARSFIAGTLIGLSIVVSVFAWMEASTSHWQTLLLLSSPVILALGIALQALITAKGSARAHIDWRIEYRAPQRSGTYCRNGYRRARPNCRRACIRGGRGQGVCLGGRGRAAFPGAGAARARKALHD